MVVLSRRHPSDDLKTLMCSVFYFLEIRQNSFFPLLYLDSLTVMSSSFF
jgi:hypothetical protein